MGKKIGFIGCGTMGGAMMEGILRSGKCACADLTGADRSEEVLKKRQEETGIAVTTDNREAAASADLLFLTVKPQFYEPVLAEIRDVLKPEAVLVTVAPGKTLAWLTGQLGKGRKIIRTMPNTPALVGEGMTGLCPNENVTQEELELVRDLCSGFSKSEVVPEPMLDVVTAVSGSAPAYVFLFLESMADAAVLGGMPRDQAYRFAAQAVLGSAKLVLETGKHPGELKDMVCTPGGTTIAAVRVLEEKGFRSAVIEAMKACLDASRGDREKKER